MLTELQQTLIQALGSQWWEGNLADEEFFELIAYVMSL
jgi:hypothetical protein